MKIISLVKLAILTSLVFGEHNIKNRDAYGDDDDDEDDDGDDDDIYIMIQCLFVTFLFIPALLPSPVQSCYVWIKRKVESRK